MPGQLTVAFGKEILEIQQLFAKAARVIAVMVQMQFDLTKASPAQFRQGVNVRRLIFLDRIKEGVPWSATVAIGKIAELPWIVANPAFDASLSLVHGYV